MTTAATITANLVLDSRQYQQGMKNAEKATASMQSKLRSALTTIKTYAPILEKIGDGFQNLGRKMSTFITLPIVGFFALIIKKAMDADTELGRMAQGSLAKLNDQLLILGEKFLPVVIKAIDFLVSALEKFNNAPPWVQKTILVFVAMLALAGPLISLTGTIINLVAGISTMGSAITTVIPAIVSLGTAIWGALLPILPIVLAIVAIVAGLAFVIWAFATDFMGVTTTLKQLFWIIGYEFKKLGQEIKQGWSDAMDWLDKETKKSADTWKENFKQAEEIKQKLFKISVETMFKWWTDFSTKVTAKISEVRNWFINAWNVAAGVFYNIFTSISNFFNSVIVGIINGINSLIGAINSLGFALESLEIPEELTPGSPTPFELGLRGISKAMDTLARSTIPELNASFAPSGVSNVGTGKTINIVDNRRFAAGMDAKTLRTALDDRFAGLTEALEGI
ncbi:MAG: hypothetical protein LC114_17905 [Bryobacterales bacterium]|nr:hypothetical protein [Bryobacterales bacterium]